MAMSSVRCTKPHKTPRSAKGAPLSMKETSIYLYLPIIKRIARRYSLPPHSPITQEDLIQEGILAALEGRNIRHAIANVAYQHRPFMEFPPSHAMADRIETCPCEEIVARNEDDSPSALQRLIQCEDKEALYRMISALRERDQTIISRLYGLKGEKPMTVRELAIAMGFTQRHIRQLRDRALRRLQKEKMLKMVKCT